MNKNIHKPATVNNKNNNHYHYFVLQLSLFTNAFFCDTACSSWSSLFINPAPLHTQMYKYIPETYDEIDN